MCVDEIPLILLMQLSKRESGAERRNTLQRRMRMFYHVQQGSLTALPRTFQNLVQRIESIVVFWIGASVGNRGGPQLRPDTMLHSSSDCPNGSGMFWKQVRGYVRGVLWESRNTTAGPWRCGCVSRGRLVSKSRTAPLQCSSAMSGTPRLEGEHQRTSHTVRYATRPHPLQRSIRRNHLPRNLLPRNSSRRKSRMLVDRPVGRR